MGSNHRHHRSRRRRRRRRRSPLNKGPPESGLPRRPPRWERKPSRGPRHQKQVHLQRNRRGRALQSSRRRCATCRTAPVATRTRLAFTMRKISPRSRGGVPGLSRIRFASTETRERRRTGLCGRQECYVWARASVYDRMCDEKITAGLESDSCADSCVAETQLWRAGMRVWYRRGTMGPV